MARLWTIQPAHVWDKLRIEQELDADEHAKDCHGYVPPAYRWLQLQLVSRLRGYGGHLPWWAYCNKPDLRSYRHGRPKDAMHVRLELEIPEEACVRFPCWAWHRVFCQDYLAATKQEYEDWTKALERAVPDEDTWPLPTPWRCQLEASWQRLFDSNLPVLNWDETSPWCRVAAQEAVFEMLRLDNVQRVTFFKGSFRLRQITNRSH